MFNLKWKMIRNENDIELRTEYLFSVSKEVYFYHNIRSKKSEVK